MIVNLPDAGKVFINFKLPNSYGSKYYFIMAGSRVLHYKPNATIWFSRTEVELVLKN